MLSVRKSPKMRLAFNLPKILTHNEYIDIKEEKEASFVRRKLKRKESIVDSRRANDLNMIKYMDIHKTIDPYLESNNSVSIKFDTDDSMPLTDKPSQYFNAKKDEFIKSLMSVATPKLTKYKSTISKSNNYTIKLNRCNTDQEINSIDLDTILDGSHGKAKLNNNFESCDSIMELMDDEPLINDKNYIPSIVEYFSLPNISMNKTLTKKIISNKISNSSINLVNNITKFSKNDGINQNNSQEKQEIIEKQTVMAKNVIKYTIRKRLTKKLKPLKLKIQDDLLTMGTKDVSRNKHSTTKILSNSKFPIKASKSPQKTGLLLENYHEEVFVLHFS